MGHMEKYRMVFDSLFFTSTSDSHFLHSVETNAGRAKKGIFGSRFFLIDSC